MSGDGRQEWLRGRHSEPAAVTAAALSRRVASSCAIVLRSNRSAAAVCIGRGGWVKLKPVAFGMSNARRRLREGGAAPLSALEEAAAKGTNFQHAGRFRGAMLQRGGLCRLPHRNLPAC